MNRNAPIDIATAFSKRAGIPFFGTYEAPDGSRLHLCSAGDVHALFRSLLLRMPKGTVVFDRRKPAERFRVMPTAGCKARKGM